MRYISQEIVEEVLQEAEFCEDWCGVEYRQTQNNIDNSRSDCQQNMNLIKFNEHEGKQN